MADITINGITVDPLAPQSPMAAATPSFGVAASAVAAAAATMPALDTNYVLIQVKGPLTASERQTLSAKGATILEYVPQNSYVCRYDPPLIR